jgi:hypothetical protein
MKKFSWLVILVSPFLFYFTGCSATQQLTATDITDTTTTGKNLGTFGTAFKMSKDTVFQIGDPQFDKFFKDAAGLDDLVRLTDVFSQNTVVLLKKTAKNAMAYEEVSDTAKKLMGSEPDSGWTVEEQAAIVKLGAKKGVIQQDVIKEYIKTGVNIELLSLSLENGIATVPELIKTGTQLSSTASSLPPSKSSLAIKAAVSISLTNLNNVKDKGPEKVKNLSKMSTAFKAFSEN